MKLDCRVGKRLGMRIPFFQPSIGDREVEAAVAVLQSGWLTTGRKCREFEERFADLLGGPIATAANNCATARIPLAAEPSAIRGPVPRLARLGCLTAEANASRTDAGV